MHRSFSLICVHADVDDDVLFSIIAVWICESRLGASGVEKLWSRCVGGHQVGTNKQTNKSESLK